MTFEISKDGFQRYRAPTPFSKKGEGVCFLLSGECERQKGE